LLETVGSVLADYANQPDDADVWQALLCFRRSTAAAIASLLPAQKEGHDWMAALELLRQFNACGAADYPASAEDLALVREYARRGCPGLMAAMLLVPAWQWPEAPRLGDVPTWFWPVYTAYIFYTPQVFCMPGQAEAYASHYLRRLTELWRLAEKNRGSAAVRAALALYLQHGSCRALYGSSDSLRRHFELRGRILTLASGSGRLEEPIMLSRAGRRLRIGVVSDGFSPQKEACANLPTHEHLDPKRFEVVLFAFQECGAALENQARGRAAGFHLLPSGLEEQVRVLREAALDVIVFSTDLTTACNAVTRLAVCRSAPLQIASSSSCTTTGLPAIDLYVSGSLTESGEAPEDYTERLALLPGPAHDYDFGGDRPEPSTSWTRGALGLPEDCIVFVTAADYRKITPEMQEAWARLLAAVPGSRLLVHPFHAGGSSDALIKRFSAGFDRVLATHGVEEDRLLVSTLRFPSRADVRGLLGLGDIYLDTHPYAGVKSLLDPLDAGIPVVAWEGRTSRSRRGGGLLRSLGLEELIAGDVEAYHVLAVRLARDGAWRVSLQTRLRDGMSRIPLFLDPLAAGDSFGGLVERAYDELCQCGREAFRRNRTPLVVESVDDPAVVLGSAASLFGCGCHSEAANQARRVLAAHPAHPAARQLLAAALLRQGRGDRALAYLLAAIRHAGKSAALWHDLAVALHHSGRKPESSRALKTCLRLDTSRVESWLMLHEWAVEAGDAETAAEAVQSVRQLAPSDPRITALVDRTIAA
jgi:protein O-GlcNAc transferase